MAVALVCPDKFRGTLTAAGAAAALARGIEAAEVDRRRFDEVRCLPLADGGEGTLEALLAAQGGCRRQATVTGPLGETVTAAWGMLPDRTAVIESARASGLALVDGPNDPLAATSRGTGELIAAAVRGGARKVVVAVGGSAMTDGGLGAVAALGWSLAGLEVTVACDVETPFLDAAAVFGPQKGATPAQVALLARRLERLAEVYRDRTGVDVTAWPTPGPPAGWPAAWPPSAPGWSPASRWWPGPWDGGRPGRRRPRGDRGGPPRRHQLRRQGGGRRPGVGRGEGVPARAVVAGQVARRAPTFPRAC